MSARRAGALVLATFALSAASLFVGCSRAPVAEDSPGWDCTTDGNGLCGPVTVILSETGAATVSGAPAPVTYAGDFGPTFADPSAFFAAIGPCTGPHPDRAVVVLAASPRDVVEHETRAAVTAPDGSCLLAVADVVLY